MIRTEQFKFTYRVKPRAVALYDLKKDPHENTTWPTIPRTPKPFARCTND